MAFVSSNKAAAAAASAQTQAATKRAEKQQKLEAQEQAKNKKAGKSPPVPEAAVRRAQLDGTAADALPTVQARAAYSSLLAQLLGIQRISAKAKKRSELREGEPQMVVDGKGLILQAALGKQMEPEAFKEFAMKFAFILQRRLEAARIAQSKALHKRSQLGLPPDAIVRATTQSLSVAARPKLTKRQTRRAMTSGVELLVQRLRFAGLRQEEMEGDGNCQFRALSHQLFDTQEEYAYVRRRVCTHMRAHEADFCIYFEDPHEWELFLTRMGSDRTWGDELTLRAAADAFGCTIHVITSTDEHWHLRYEPEGPTPAKLLFLTYVSPVHYNAICRTPVAESMSAVSC